VTCYIILVLVDPKKQLELAVRAVFNSWDSPRANKYRAINQITGLKGTAVNVQCMVFGNMGDTSGTGVLFTRNPSTGEKKLYGEYLINAQVWHGVYHRTSRLMLSAGQRAVLLCMRMNTNDATCFVFRVRTLLLE
jgi:hypothetical protein